MRLSAPVARRSAPVARRSVSFSGAGFLGAYHMGALSALRQHGFVPDFTKGPDDTHPDLMLLGASAGALSCAAVVAATPIDDAMGMVHTCSRLAAAQPLDALTPGFSLIDQIEPEVCGLLSGVDPELLAARLAHGRLRVSLTTPSAWSPVAGMRNHRFIDEW